jgi:hypothetical protein
MQAARAPHQYQYHFHCSKQMEANKITYPSGALPKKKHLTNISYI